MSDFTKKETLFPKESIWKKPSKTVLDRHTFEFLKKTRKKKGRNIRENIILHELCPFYGEIEPVFCKIANGSFAWRYTTELNTLDSNKYIREKLLDTSNLHTSACSEDNLYATEQEALEAWHDIRLNDFYEKQDDLQYSLSKLQLAVRRLEQHKKKQN